MTKRIFLHTGYWLLILAFLTIYFGYNWQDRLSAFYFSCMLLPVVIGTTYFFNLFLVPQYLFTGRYWAFGLYLFYMLVVSLYLELLVALLSFVILANYQTSVMGIQSMSIFVLGANLYLIVFITSFIRLVLQFQQKSKQVSELKTEIKKKDKPVVILRSDRKNHHIQIEDLILVESLNDYIKVITRENELTVREKITNLHSRLPSQFVRIHRSFIVNKEHVDSFTRTDVRINNQHFPISRTYKNQALELLGGK